MQKQKEYDWKDSNLALFGSDTDKAVKKASAITEKAWEPVGKCQQPHLFIWRIEKFQVKEWPKEDYGKFYSGDSYIVLNVYKEPSSPELLYDVHFWIGQESTQDEYGTAAYKTVEVDTYLDDKAIQHREVQGHESPLFKSYFKTITYLKGGCDSGFRHVTTKEYKPRLLHFTGTKVNVIVQEVDATVKCLDSGDVFVLDLGTTAYQWNGSGCNKDEKFKAAQYLQTLESERCGKTKTEVIDEADAASNKDFMAALGTHEPSSPVKKQAPVAPGKDDKHMFRLSDASGKLEFNEIATGKLEKSKMDENDVHIIDNGETVYVYVGKGASQSEKKNALSYAHNYLQKTMHPFLSVTVIDSKAKGKNVTDFNAVFAA